MATHDYNIANQTALNFRGDLNDALEAIVSTNSNATAPTTTYAHMFWYDTTNDLLKMRDETNSAWITVGYIDQANLNFQPYIGGTQVTEVLDEDDMASDSDTGVPTQQSVRAYVEDYVADNTPTDFGAIGTYCLAYRVGENVSTNTTRGSTVSGSSLRPAGLSFSNMSAKTEYVQNSSVTALRIGRGTSSSTLSGTWRLMGEFQNESAAHNDYPVSLYVRIA